MSLIDAITTRFKGNQYEDLAAKHVKSAGLEIVQRNFSCKKGEIDIIAKQGERLIFIEVRFRKSAHFGSAANTVNKQKQQKIRYTAEYYLKQNQLNINHVATRFDIIAFDGGPQQIRWLKAAF